MNIFENKSIAKEINKIRSFKYDDLCDYLRNKYGEVDGPYFINENCATKNEKIKRTDEGLFIHHVFENKVVMLSHFEYAIQYPFAWQEGRNLVYCNYFEHMLLHLAIVKEFLKTEAKKTKMAVGIGGLLNYMIPEIIDYINGYNYARDYMKKALSIVDGNEILFIDIIKELEWMILDDYDIFSIVYDSIGRSRRRLTDAFKCGKMTNSGRFDDFIFKYDIVKKQIRLVDSQYFLSVVENAMNKPGYDYKFDVRPHGEYYFVAFDYHNKQGSVTYHEYALRSSDQVDFESIKKHYFKPLILSERISYLIKKNSVVSSKENKKSKNKNKRFCLTVDGIVVEYNNFTKEEALEFVKKNN